MTANGFLDALLSLPALEYPRVSKDGQWVAWTWYRAGPAAEVFAARTDGSTGPIRLTSTPDNTLPVSWTADSRSVLVAQDRDGNERAQLFRVDVDKPGVMHPLTEPSPSYFLRGGQLHPNGRWLVYGANVDVATGAEIEATWLYRHDLVSGERLVLARPQRGCHYEPALNAKGSHIIYHRNDLHPAGLQVWLVDIDGQRDREILNVGADKKVRASWFPDGCRALVLAEADAHRRVGIWEEKSGLVRWVFDDPARNVVAAWAPHGCDWVVVQESIEARTHATLLDPNTGEQKHLPEISGTLVPLAPAATGGWVGHCYHSRQPVDVVRFAMDAHDPGSFQSLTHVWERTSLTSEDLVPAEDYRWQSVDGLEIQGWLYRARGKVTGTIVYVHGGPTWHSEDWINVQIQYLCSRGFNVLDPNYRGSTGFGLEYQEAIKEDGWGGREQEDLRTGIEAMIADGIAEPGRIGITGTSYGGYSAWWAITKFPPGLVAASAPICGMTDLAVDWETTRPDARPYSEEMMGGSPLERPTRYRRRSPLHHVENIQGGLLIVQGMQDPNVTPENVRVVRLALDEEGIDYELLFFDDEGHGISRPKNQRILYARLAAFFTEAFGET